MRAILRDLEACIADCEWERAGSYLDELPAHALGASRDARTIGAMVHTLLGLQRAIDRQDIDVGLAAIRHLDYLADLGGSRSAHA